MDSFVLLMVVVLLAAGPGPCGETLYHLSTAVLFFNYQ
jgi:hypothetical protein